MVGKQISIILAFALGYIVAVGATEYQRERYDVIIERFPFGDEPMQLAESTNMHEKRAQDRASSTLQKEMRLCFLLEGESGDIRAGFQNLKAQQGDPKNILLMVGESFRGMKLLEVDLPSSRVSLMLNGKPVSFELSKASPAQIATPKPRQPTRRFGGGFRKSSPATKSTEPELSPEEQAQKRAEVRENLRQYQMEVIRAGMPPLPIPLTPEMDDQLVAEGVLPPSE